ncbi:ATP-binding cassette domain-containing protein [Mariniblastus sp.]|jgi:ABC-2 type transport system ATP-binding protein|nr:ATP-binding cassette domain-containing protein [Mariniblastus sp.]MDB4755905.1 ATP-binding cassette domain-containing protein [Mariniblastus sp.]
MQNAIELAGVTKRFGKKTAVDGLDLAVPTGAIYGFIGPNGSGKTTTLRMILRIIQPDSGQVAVLGKLRGRTADDQLGYLPEERGMYKRMKARELLIYFSRLKGRYDAAKNVDQWLEKLGAAEWANMKIETLSKGMAQKIQFISAIVTMPKLVILDEPFSGLDPVNMEVLRDAVLELRENGTTVIFSTHDMDMAQQMCDTIFMVFQGKKVLDGTLSEIQATYPANRVRVILSDTRQEFPSIDGIENLTQTRNSFEFKLENIEEKQRILQQLAARVSLDQFEVIRPTLHEIFVRIARPENARAESLQDS